MIMKKKVKFLQIHALNEEFKKQQQDLKRKEGELEKISQVITKKADLIKA